MSEQYAKAWTNGDGRTLWQPVVGNLRMWEDGYQVWREYGKLPYLTSRRKAVRMGRRRVRRLARQAWTEADPEVTP